MGAYMTRPSTEKSSDSGFTDWITYGVSSMQGWRMQQEDAHNCEPEFDPSRFASLFAVYDGHGGSEVARYCAAYLPAFLKDLPTYATDDPAEVLKQLFVDFDASLVTPEARAILHSLAEKNEKQSEDEIDASDDTDEDGSDSEISALREEANEPLESVLERYGGEDALPMNIKDLLVRRRKVKPGECSNAQISESTVNSVDGFDSRDRGTFTPGDRKHNEKHGSIEALKNGLNGYRVDLKRESHVAISFEARIAWP
ncbi:hypothetical protein CRM22_002959 [Opisthorchis felineus]|uniref:PPM-type phosphatase domain-containing protein n=1 Tax=Opisthorchis felineus TaxID=147828 RepID=A0A4S2M3I1_OPIFE|nr:hypothetical protein CRM22_002959 [Opisthorchis felineus]